MRGLTHIVPSRVYPLLLGLVHTGQSLSTGDFGAPASTTNVGGNLQLHDSSGTYDTTTPHAGTLSLINLIAPIRADKFGGTGGDVSQYPINIGGESPEVAAANGVFHVTSKKVAATSVGQGGAAMSVIKKGGSGNAYAAAIYEVTAIFALSPGYQVLATMLTHGEADATAVVATYQAQIAQLQSDFQTDIKAITGQGGSIPMLVSQQNAFPSVGAGGNNSAVAQWLAIKADPTHVVGVCPKYQYSYQGDRAHLQSASYVLLGEKYGQVATVLAQGGTWTPLIATAFSKVSTTVTVTFNVPVGPLQWAGNSAPHQNGTTYGDNGSAFGGAGHAGWTAGKGFELWTGGYGGTPVAITSCTISGSTVVIVGASAFDTVAYAHTPDATASVFTGGFPDGRCGLLEDSDTFAGISGTAQPNRCFEFMQGGL